MRARAASLWHAPTAAIPASIDWDRMDPFATCTLPAYVRSDFNTSRAESCCAAHPLPPLCVVPRA